MDDILNEEESENEYQNGIKLNKTLLENETNDSDDEPETISESMRRLSI